MTDKENVTMGISFAYEVGNRKYEVIKVLVEVGQEIRQHQPVMIVLPINDGTLVTAEAITLKSPLAGFISSIVPTGSKTSAPNSVVMSITGNKKVTNSSPTIPKHSTIQPEKTSSNSLLTSNEVKAINELQTKLDNISSRLDQEVIKKESWTATGDTKKALIIWLTLCTIASVAGGKNWGLMAFAIGFMYVFLPLAFGTKTEGELQRSRYREPTPDETLIRNEINALKKQGVR